MSDKINYSLFMSLDDDLGKTFQTMKRWYDTNTCPAEICIKIERLTNGVIKSHELRPDIFVPTLSQLSLFETFIGYCAKPLVQANYGMVVSLLNYFEHDCPNLYKQAVTKLSEMPSGVILLDHRKAHRQNVSN